MLLEITHQTDLAYSELISETQMELRMCPRQEQDQHRLSFDLAIGPQAGVTSYFDWLGNTVHAFTINAFHKQIRIIATSIVETDRVAHDPQGLADIWPFPVEDDYAIYDYLHFDGPIVDSPALRQLVAEALPEEGILAGELVTRMMRQIDELFTYEQGITTAASPITEVLEHGRGVCQDFTHLLIGMARAVGIPARYVSGFLHADESDGRYRGLAQTHAWCELLFPSVGWIGFDPTNKCAVGNNFVKLDVGRHYRDVAPNRGTFRGGSMEKMTVSVKTRELGAIPPQLAPERMQSLQIPTYPGWGTVGLEQIRQLEEQQQQQKQREQQQQQQQQ